MSRCAAEAPPAMQSNVWGKPVSCPMKHLSCPYRVVPHSNAHAAIFILLTVDEMTAEIPTGSGQAHHRSLPVSVVCASNGASRQKMFSGGRLEAVQSLSLTVSACRAPARCTHSSRCTPNGHRVLSNHAAEQRERACNPPWYWRSPSWHSRCSCMDEGCSGVALSITDLLSVFGQRRLDSAGLDASFFEL